MSEALASIMGSICSCLHVEDLEDYVNRNSSMLRNCICLNCFLQNFFHMYSSVFRRSEVQSLSSSMQGASAASDSSLADMYRSPPRPLPYDTDPRFHRMQRGGLFSRREKGSTHSHDESEPLRREDSDADSESFSTRDKLSESTCNNGSKESRKSSMKLSSAKSTAVMGYFYSSSEDEDVCPTCLEEYNEDNPKIVTKCCHHFHLGCIYEWMERSENCPVCGKVMAFDESP